MRIIGGSLRGSRLEVAAAPGLRPTPDRVRETLFNWLAPVIEGARCLDVFAGTGALGIEALSRGAAQVGFVERDPQLVALLQQNLQRLKQERTTVHRGDALRLLAQPPASAYDIAFLDPPFTDGLWATVALALETHGWLRDNAWIYLETPVQEIPSLPSSWMPHREARAGAVRYALYRRHGASVKL